STSIFEGLSLGLRTFILDIPGSEVFNDLIERGIAKKVTSAKELIAFMKDRNDLAPVDVEQLFLSNSIENFKAFLKDKIH
ncbi:MAG: sialyltransferase, partial [Candidatus Thorarchaeota archaeon]